MVLCYSYFVSSCYINLNAYKSDALKTNQCCGFYELDTNHTVYLDGRVLWWSVKPTTLHRNIIDLSAVGTDPMGFWWAQPP